MLIDQIGNVELSRFQRLLESMIADPLQLNIFDADGVPCWSGGEQELVSMPALTVQLRAHGLFARNGEEHSKNWPLDSGHTLFCSALGIDAAGIVGWLVLCLATNERSVQDRARVAACLQEVATCIGNECALNSELEEMALDLGQRYEQLNLIFRFERLDSPEQSSGATFRQVLAHCTRVLKIDGVAMLLPHMQVALNQPSLESGWVEPNSHMPAYTDVLYGVMQRVATGFAINNVNDRMQAFFWEPLRIKIVAAPIVDTFSRVCGTLFVYADPNRPDFTNGDRQVVEAIADKLSKLIRANQDHVTGLQDRKHFESELAVTLATLRQGAYPAVLLALNVTNLYVVSDTLQQEVADECLRHCAEILRLAVRPGDVIARLGDGRFGALFRDCTLECAQRIAQCLTATFTSKPFVYDGAHYDLVVNLGLTEIGPRSGTLADVMGEADAACRVSEELGERICSYDEQNVALRRYKSETQCIPQIQRALQGDGFVLYSQKIAPVKAGAPDHYELLIRLRGDDGQIVSPGVFLPAAERYDLMPAIDRWVIRHAFGQLAACTVDSARREVWCINLSGQSLGDPELFPFVLAEQARSGVALNRICFEITETGVIRNFASAMDFMERLKSMGCSFSLDDFGTGLSSFSYLQKMPLDHLKIDGSFVRELLTDPVAINVVRSINQIGHTLGLETVAEFVENAGLVTQLQEIGLDYLQGYHIAKPEPLSDLLSRLSLPVVNAA